MSNIGMLLGTAFVIGGWIVGWLFTIAIVVAFVGIIHDAIGVKPKWMS